MNAHVTLVTENETVRRLVADYVGGLGCAVAVLPASEGGGIRTELPDVSGALLDVLTHVALTATKAGVDPSEPLCRVTYRFAGAAAEVTLGLRIAELQLHSVATPGA